MIAYPPVKLNLGLNVLRKRPDGFHDLETLFLPYPDIHDILEIVPAEAPSETVIPLLEKYAARERAQAISPDGKVMITLARQGGVDWDPLCDLTARSYALLSDLHGGLPAVKIFLEKRAPVGAGLGGGSSDAATALKMLNTLFALGHNREELSALAAQLGSDCAFFLYETPMFGTGRGEILEPFDIDLSGLRFQVFVPDGIAVSTADAYRGIVPRLPEKPLREILRQPVSTWKEELKNDFEETVFRKYPALAGVKERLYAEGALYAAMSGSGSAFFATFRK